MRGRRSWLAAIGLVAVLAVVGMVAALLDNKAFALACAIALLGVAASAAVDVRHRTADLAHMARVAAARQGDQTARLHVIDSNVKSALGGLGSGTIEEALGAGGRLEAMERRLLALLESERLRAADRERESDQRMRQQTAELVAAIGAVDSALRGAGGRTTNGTPDERTR